MKNYKNNWIKPAFDIPNDYREVLLTCEGYPDTLIGYYCHDTGKWKVFVDDKMETFDDVYAWKDKPRPLKIDDSFVFRKAEEARYLTEVALNLKSKDDEYKNFMIVRSSILNATLSGKWKVSLDKTYFSDKICNALREARFVINYFEGFVTISWDNIGEK